MSKSYIDGINIISCSSSFYNDTGHGLVVKIKGKKELSLNLNITDIKLNIFGEIWSSLPLGIDKVVKWSYLPLSLYPNYIRKPLKLLNTVEDFEIEIFLGTKDNGQIGILHQTITNQLSSLIKNGNPIIELEFTYRDANYKYNPFFSIFTRPELIKNSLLQTTTESILYSGPIPSDIRDGNDLFRIIRWLFYPILFLFFCWFSFFDSKRFTSRLPVLFYTEKLNTSISNLLRPVPNTMSQCWEISRLEHECQQLEKSPKVNQERIQEILGIVSKSFGGRNITPEELHEIYHAIKEKESHKDLSSRIYGFFNFINLLWLLSIIGIVISIGPSIYLFLKPFQDALLELARVIWNRIIIPCHSWGVFEFLAYLLCVLFVSEGYRYKTDSGFYIALNGVFGAIPSLIYSYFLHCPYKPSKNFYIFYYLFACSFLVPIAIYYQSKLLAWLVIIILYSCIGFSFMVLGMCYLVGFEDEESMIRVSFSSVILGGFSFHSRF